MKQFIRYTLAIIFIQCFVIATMSAQPKKKLSKKALAKQAAMVVAKDLKSNTLVVRLSSGSNKQLRLEELLEDKTLSEKQRKYIQEQLDLHIQFTTRTNQSIMNGFKGHYTFSKVLFMYNSNSKALYKNQKQGYFLNDDLTVDPAITLTTATFYTCDLQRISTKRTLEGFIIQNDKKEKPKRPFPTISAVKAWSGFLSKKTPSYDQTIIRLNGRLSQMDW